MAIDYEKRLDASAPVDLQTTKIEGFDPQEKEIKSGGTESGGPGKRIISFEELEDFITTTDGLKRDIDSLAGKVAKVEKNVTLGEQKIETAAEKTKSKVTETLAIFASLFTFISVSFQIFSRVTNPLLAAAILLILGGFLLIFDILVHFMMRPKPQNQEYSFEDIKQTNWKQKWDYVHDKITFLILNDTTLVALFLVSLLVIFLGALLAWNSQFSGRKWRYCFFICQYEVIYPITALD